MVEEMAGEGGDACKVFQLTWFDWYVLWFPQDAKVNKDLGAVCNFHFRIASIPINIDKNS